MNNTTLAGQTGLVISSMSAAAQASVSDDTQFYANLTVALVGVIISTLIAFLGYRLKRKEYMLAQTRVIDVDDLTEEQVRFAKEFVDKLKECD